MALPPLLTVIVRNSIVHGSFSGTSTDVSRYAGSYEHVFETTTAGVSIQAPQACVVSCSYPHVHFDLYLILLNCSIYS